VAGKPKRELEELRGTVTCEVVRAGTAGEHEAVVLCTVGGERLILQRIGGNPFADEATRALAGHEARVQGFRVGSVFRYRKAERTDGATG
jgi:hypothetical protein